MPEENNGKIFDFSNGITWYAVALIKLSEDSSETILYELGQIFGSLKLSIGLDYLNNLRAWLIDDNGEWFESDPIEFEKFANKITILRCSISKFEGSSVAIELNVNNTIQVKKLIKASLGSPLLSVSSINSDLSGQKKCDSDIYEILTYSGFHSELEKTQVYQYLTSEWSDDR